MSANADIENGCYVYKPHDSSRTATQQLLRERSSPSRSSLEAFHQFWRPIETRLLEVISQADANTVQEICKFLDDTIPEKLDLLPVGLVTTSTAATLFDQVKAKADRGVLFISVPAGQCTNLKIVLKGIISSVDVANHGRLLSYDLEVLETHIGQEHFTKVVLYFGNGESLHGGVLSDLIDVLDSWRDRIPFILMFETAVSIELFQEKLTRRALRQLRGRAFSAASALHVVEIMFQAASTAPEQKLWMGSGVASMLLERQTEHRQSAQAFVQAVKYMYMTHFYRSPLSGLLIRSDFMVSKDTLRSARQLKSFKAHLENMREDKKGKEATRLLQDDGALADLVGGAIENGAQNLMGLAEAVKVLSNIQELTTGKNALPWSKLYTQAMSGELAESATMKNLMLSLRAMPSNKMLEFLEELADLQIPGKAELHASLSTLIAEHGNEMGPLRSEHDTSHETTRTTVIAKRISLSKQKAALSRRDTEYSQFVRKVDALFKGYFQQKLINPKDLLFHEIFLFDLRVPLREAFSPRPRYALEHALTVPGAYLACECCDPDQRVLSYTQPATAVLYQLYLESGVMINIGDLWAAFNSIISSADEDFEGGDEIGQDEQKLALFYQALAELRYLGFIKSSRKKADHLMKVKFIGL